MARQRFIWPTIWKDPVFGRLQPLEQILFIGMFSIADDEGRLLADPAYLRAEVFPYKDYTHKKVLGIRDSVVAKCNSVHLYPVNAVEYIVLLNWHDFQKPKYPKPSKIPPPFPQDSPNASPVLKPVGETPDPWVGLGREGLGRVGLDRDGKGCGDDPAVAEESGNSADFRIPDKALKEADAA